MPGLSTYLRQRFAALTATLRPGPIEARLDEEQQFHLDMATERNRRAGMSPEEARRAALIAYGGRDRFREEARDAVRDGTLDALLRDLRYAARGMGRRRGLVATIVLTLALGVGATTTVFSVVNGVLLRPLPYPEADRLVALVQTWEGHEGPWSSVSPAEAFDYLDRLTAFSAFGVYDFGESDISGDGEAEPVAVAAVSHGAMSALGIRPAIGRTISPEDDRPGGNDVVLLTDAIWRRRYAADPAVLGRRIMLDGRATTVIGVLPPGFRLPDDMARPDPAEVIVPLALDRQSITIRGSHHLSAVGRLRAGATPEAADAQVAGIAAAFTAAFPDEYKPANRFTAAAVPLQATIVGDSRATLLLLLAATGCILVIACVNAAGLLLAQAEARQREMAVRTALGAGRRVLLRQLLVESSVLGAMAGAAGIVLSTFGTRLLAGSRAVELPRLAELSIDLPVLAFGLGVTLLATLAFGLVPALRLSSPDLQGTLRSGGRGATGGMRDRHLRQALIAGQIAIAMALLLGAGLLTKSFARLLAVDPGFDADGAVAATISVPSGTYPDEERVIEFVRQLLDRVRTIPGVSAAGAVAGVPLVAPRGDIGIELEGRPTPAGAPRLRANWQVVTPGYFEAIGMRMRRGRAIGPRDVTGVPGAVVVNETMAQRYWAGDPIGKRFKLGGGAKPDTVTVVGVVGDVRQAGLAAEVEPEMYLAHAQFRFWGGGSVLRTVNLVAGGPADPAAVSAGIRRELRALSPDVPLGAVQSMRQVRSASVAQPRFMMLLLAASAAIAFTIGAVGLYSLISYSVARRRKEFGVRMALGARPGDVIRLVVREGVTIAAWGIAIGVPLALAFSRLLERFLFSVRPSDPLLVGLVALLLAGVAVAAAYFPARRASRTDSLTALREE